MKIYSILKNWTLPIAMIFGVSSYLIYKEVEILHVFGPSLNQFINIIQPILIFAMLFVTFCKINIKDFKITVWHLKLAVLQVGIFIGLTFLLFYLNTKSYRILIESMMICIICPTATAANVVCSKLGGNINSLTTYIIIINIIASIIIPICIPFIETEQNINPIISFISILKNVFPVLFGPLISALIIRKYFPSITSIILYIKDLAFYLWSIALSIAMASTTKSFINSNISAYHVGGIAIISLICCIFQFWYGRKIGTKYNDSISAGQAIGQKNTIFAIWLANNFFTPVTAIAGGFYSIWHNIYNSYQLYKKRNENIQ